MSVAALPAPKPETVAQRVKRLQAEAKALAGEHVATMARSMVDLSNMAADVANGGDAYHAGTREAARQLADELESRLLTLTAIMSRTK